MNAYSFPESSAPLRRVSSVQFGVLSPEEIKAMSVVKVEYGETYENGKPKMGGLLDPRMGSVDRHQKCLTCQESMNDCPGHFGHIELVKPMYHVGFMSKIKKILECVCFNCSRLRVAPEKDKDPDGPHRVDKVRHAMSIKDPKARMKAIHEICKTKMICQEFDENGKQRGCGASQPTIRKEGLSLMIEMKDKQRGGSTTSNGKSVMTAEKALSVLKKISDEDCKLLGLNVKYARPEWMIFTVLPVPPPAVRPSVQVDSGARGEDDLTHKLADIVKQNNTLKRYYLEGTTTQRNLEAHEALLQFHVVTYIDNDASGQPQALQKNGRPLKSLRARLKGKEGRLRGNLMGKRVDFSARTVITGDPNISLDEVGVPRSIAKTLTFPELVTPFNIDKMRELVKNGPDQHPGARFVVRENGERIDLRFCAQGGEIRIEPGCKVERHINDGDIVIFNRQPSLHKMSMMGHRVRVMPYSTFRLNLSVTTPYNADFDGDEMNLHVPQSYESRAEIKELCMVPLQIVSPQSNKPVMGIVQDTLCGVRKFTLRDNFISREMAMQLCLTIPNWDGKIPEPAVVKPLPLWTGKQILSMIIPKGINLVGYHSAHPDDEVSDISAGDTKVFVRDGEIMCGIICKKTVGTSQNGLVHVIWKEHGPMPTRDFFDGCQRVVNYWLLHFGFTVGIGDTIVNKATMKKIEETVIESKKRVDDILQQAKTTGLDKIQESKINQELNKARDVAGKLAQRSLSSKNNVKQMVIAGSKGSVINISQMAACVGQQNVESKRVPFGFEDRSLPHFTKGDHGPESRGFVENSYLIGLTPPEFFFHAMGGREGLIDTAVRTAETGYIQRRLVKALEDVMVKYDGTVRNALGAVIQFQYGEDGMDGTAVEHQKLDILSLSDAEFDRRYRHLTDAIDLEEEDRRIVEQEYLQLKNDRHILRTEIMTTGDDTCPLPVNIRRMIWRARCSYGDDRRLSQKDKTTQLKPSVVIRKVTQLLERIASCGNESDQLLFSILVRSNLASKRIIHEYGLRQPAFDWIIDNVEKRYRASLVQPGEMVGTIAAQSIGEPATQMTLNTFHYAGVSAKTNVTLGVPRLREIINVAKKLSSPTTYVYLKEAIAFDYKGARDAQIALEHSLLKDVVEKTEVWYDAEIGQTVVEEDEDIVMSFYALTEPEELGKLSRWMLRIVLKRSSLIERDISTSFIVHRIKEEFKDDVHVIGSDDNAVVPVIRIRMVKDAEKESKRKDKSSEKESEAGTGPSSSASAVTVRSSEQSDGEDEEVFLKKMEACLLNTLSLRGIRDITKAYISEKPRPYVDEEGRISQKTEFLIETDGLNLREIMAGDSVDATRTYSNNISEVLEVLGIEAARAVLLKELRNVIEFDGSYVNYRHLALLCDQMTHRGYLMAYTRHGINRTEVGALARCSFEETVEVLMDAAVNGDIDDCKGVAENIMFGQLAPVGTGQLQLYLDQEVVAAVSAKSLMKSQSVNKAHKDNDLDDLVNAFEEKLDVGDGDYEMPIFVPSFSATNWADQCMND